jgi:hypothetical protein
VRRTVVAAAFAPKGINHSTQSDPEYNQRNHLCHLLLLFKLSILFAHGIIVPKNSPVLRLAKI